MWAENAGIFMCKNSGTFMFFLCILNYIRLLFDLIYAQFSVGYMPENNIKIYLNEMG
jgi:hypothetical protein